MQYTNTRNPHHDYHSRCIYLITINKAGNIPAFSRCERGRDARSVPGVRYSKVGQVISDRLRLIPELFPKCSILRYIIMPDHIHFVIFFTEKADYKLGDVVAAFKAKVTQSLDYGTIFAKGFHDRICRYDGQLRRMVDYVTDNPRRWIVRKENYQWFQRPNVISLFGEDFTAFGNFLLLRNPVISAVRISRSFTAEQLEGRRQEWRETMRANGVLVSPFISKAEKRIMHEGIESGSNIILLTREEMGPRYKPQGNWFDLCAAGRLLIISTGKALTGEELSRPESLAMNALAERISGGVPEDLRLRRLG